MNDTNESTLDFQRLWNTFVANWKWFLISVIAFIIVAGIYLWFTPTKVNIRGKIQITDKNKQESPMSVGASMLNALPMGLGNSLGVNELASEMELLMSNALARDVVNDLNLHTEYRLCNWGRKTLLYQNQPVNVMIPPSYLQWLDEELPVAAHQITLFITKHSDGYTVETTLKENKEETDLPDQSFAKLPATIQTGEGTLTLTENTLLKEKDRKNYQKGYTLKVTIIPPIARAMDFEDHLLVEKSSTNASDIAYMTLEDENAKRGVDFLNHLAIVFNNYSNKEKNNEALKTEAFVNERLDKIDQELGTSDEALEKTKKSYQIINPAINAEEVVEKKNIYEAKMVEIGTQLQLLDYLSEYINNPAHLYEIIPVGLGLLEDPSLITLHNTYVNQRNQLLKSMSEQSPPIRRLTETIQELQPSLQTAITRGRQNILAKREIAQREYNNYRGRVSSAPQMERVLTDIGRQREIQQSVYLLLLQKREETAMSLANTTDKGKLFDETLVVKNSNHPKKSWVLLAALIFGLVFPMPIFFFRLVFNSKN